MIEVSLGVNLSSYFAMKRSGVRFPSAEEIGTFWLLGQPCRTSFPKLVLKADEVALCLDCSSELKCGHMGEDAIVDAMSLTGGLRHGAAALAAFTESRSAQCARLRRHRQRTQRLSQALVWAQWRPSGSGCDQVSGPGRTTRSGIGLRSCPRPRTCSCGRCRTARSRAASA